MVWLGKEKCSKAFEEISSLTARWWPQCFLSRKKGIKNFWRKRKQQLFMMFFHRWKIRTIWGNLYIRYHAKESTSIVIFLCIVGLSILKALLKKINLKKMVLMMKRLFIPRKKSCLHLESWIKIKKQLDQTE